LGCIVCVDLNGKLGFVKKKKQLNTKTLKKFMKESYSKGDEHG